jgi:hypothetical protein
LRRERFPRQRFVYQRALAGPPRSMYPSPLVAFFFPYWGFFAKSGASARNIADRPHQEVARSTRVRQLQKALEVDPMRSAEIARLWGQMPR